MKNDKILSIYSCAPLQIVKFESKLWFVILGNTIMIGICGVKASSSTFEHLTKSSVFLMHYYFCIYCNTSVLNTESPTNTNRNN